MVMVVICDGGDNGDGGGGGDDEPTGPPTVMGSEWRMPSALTMSQMPAL